VELSTPYFALLCCCEVSSVPGLPMQYARSLLQLRYCLLNLSVRAAFTRPLKRLAVFLLGGRGGTSYLCLKAVAVRMHKHDVGGGLPITDLNCKTGTKAGGCRCAVARDVIT
jgi:hypothetical protein